ncbi:MAG: SAM-dependent methyltransferase [Bacteroidetes bacterium]|nr:SAM-dependent methyltransferase [Bacteroidota bacterium]
MELDQNYWEERYKEANTPWDIGYASPPLIAFLDQLENLDTRILIPGAGKAYEAIYLHQKGFKAVFVCDWAKSAFDLLRAKAPDFPEAHLICSDFFELDGCYDLIIEQTFFCAIPPSLRKAYVSKVEKLLRKQGSLAGLLFASHFENAGPPFGGTENDYRNLFSEKFVILRMSIAKNSILPRSHNELFFQLIKK